MTITVKVRFDNSKRDENKARGVAIRIPVLEKLLKMSSKPYRIQECCKARMNKRSSLMHQSPLYYGWDFYVDEFFEQAVRDMLMTLEMDDDEWTRLFIKKYRLEGA